MPGEPAVPRPPRQPITPSKRLACVACVSAACPPSLSSSAFARLRSSASCCNHRRPPSPTAALPTHACYLPTSRLELVCPLQLYLYPPSASVLVRSLLPRLPALLPGLIPPHTLGSTIPTLPLPHLDALFLQLDQGTVRPTSYTYPTGILRYCFV